MAIFSEVYENKFVKERRRLSKALMWWILSETPRDSVIH